MSHEPRGAVRRAASGALWALALLALLPAPEAVAKARGCPAGMVGVRGKFCIDAYEASVDIVNARGRTLRHQSPYQTPADDARIRARSRRGVVPQAYISQAQAEAACEAAGKRLCSDSEWLEACKGRDPTLYPYGDEHQDGRCNDEGVSPLRTLHGKDDGLGVFGIEAMNDPRLNQIPGTVARTGKFRRCRSSFGTYDMVGNLHEWTADPGGTFRGGYYLDNEINGRGCDYVTKAHDTKYHDYSIGFRCCKGGPEDEKAKARSAARKEKKRAKGGKPRVHTVESGDTLSGIAQRYDVTVQDICEANHIEKSSPIHPGQELAIPD